MKQRIHTRSLLLGLLLAALGPAALPARSQTLVYATSSATQLSNTVEEFSLPSSANSSVFTATGTNAGSNGVLRCTAIALDASAQKVFLLDGPGQKIWSMNVNGGGLTTVASIPTSTPTDLTLDSANQLIYFTTSSYTLSNNTIQRMSYSGANRTVLFSASNGVTRCTALALDTSHSQIIFSDAGTNALWSITSSGALLTPVIQNLPGVPLDLALDVTNEAIYYVTSSTIQSNNTVHRVFYGGERNVLLLTATGGTNVQRCTAIDYDPVALKLYLADAGASALWSLNSDGSGLASVDLHVLSTPRRVKLLPAVQAAQPTPAHLTVIPQTFQEIAADGFELSLAGATNFNYVLEYSTNLLNWIPLSTNLMPPAGVITIFDTTAKNSPQDRFYRAFGEP
jgi:hypothetical protein